jgi:hypothetical protein
MVQGPCGCAWLASTCRGYANGGSLPYGLQPSETGTEEAMSDTPQADRVEQDEFALLANEYRSTAARLRETADACRLTGRSSLAVRYETRAWAVAQAGLCCEQKLEEARRERESG